MRADRLGGMRAFAVLAVVALLGLLTFGSAMSVQAASYVPINGAGSSYAYPALNQWGTDLANQGLHITYTPNGSASGRQQYLDNLLDFAGSDIAFITNGDPDPFGGVDAPVIQFAYSYVPDVAGGLSFLYNLQVNGQRVTNMRLSGQTLAEIFTGHIKNWDDSVITHDYGKQLPSIPITVVTRSDGAGESYFLTRWLDKEYSNLWIPFCESQGGPKNCGTGPTEDFPGQNAGFKALNGADGVAGYVAASSNNGAIGYAEYAYAKDDQVPTVNMLNAAGYYVGPTAGNVAIALEKAQIDLNQGDVNFLMQDLDQVYTDPDPRAYPLSAYSYLIVPRTSRTVGGVTYKPLSSFNTSKGASLSTYINYMLCGAQSTAADLGYSPLPEPMVKGGFLQDGDIPGAVASPAAGNYNTCNNPAYKDGKDVLTATAAYPSPCQKVTASLSCTSNVASTTGNSAGGGGKSGGGSSGNGGSGSGTTGQTGGSGGSTSPGGTGGTGGTSSGPGSSVKINPNTGQVESGTTTGSTNVNAQPVSLTSRPAAQWLFGTISTVELLAVLIVPVMLGMWLQRRRSAAGSRN